jgi:hypothetical protein
MADPFDRPDAWSGQGGADAGPHLTDPGPGDHQADQAPAPAPDGAEVGDGCEPLGVVVPATGNAEVDEAVERLADADELPTRAHIEVYEDVHRGLRDALAALDENRS